MQFRYLIFGLIFAACFVGVQWLNDQPGIPPVRLPGTEAPVTVVPHNTKDSATATLDRSSLGTERTPPSVASVAGLPGLNDSDVWLKDRLADGAVPWLAETDLVRTLAAVLENASRGELPTKFLGFLAPEGKFSVTSSAGGFQANGASYARYDNFVATLESLSPERAAELFRMVEPLLAEAIRELGEETETPKQLAYTALGVALATPRVDEDVQLKQPKLVYTYEDKALEELLPLQKQLLRMGPDNLFTVRIWLEDFGAALSTAGDSGR